MSRESTPEIHPARGTPNPAAAPFRLTARVRWSDVDAAGIVCYGSYLRFFELAETELLRALGLTVAGMRERHGIWLVRRRIECDFHRPARLDDDLDVVASIVGIGRTSLEFRFFIRRAVEAAVAVEAHYVLVAVDRESLRPAPLPGVMRRVLERAEVGAGTADGSACPRSGAAAVERLGREIGEIRSHAATVDGGDTVC